MKEQVRMLVSVYRISAENAKEEFDILYY